MNLCKDEVILIVDALKHSTDIFEDLAQGGTKHTSEEHLTYLKEKALIAKLRVGLPQTK